MRQFVLDRRDQDGNTTEIAEGMELSDGRVTLAWRDGANPEVSVYTTVDDLTAIYCYPESKTTLRWVN